MTEGFAAIPNWMIRDVNVSRRAIVVYGALASRNGRGGIFPSQGQIAEDARCDERTVRRALKELEDLGVVERVRRSNKSGHRMSDGYVLHPNGALEDGAESLRSDVSGRDDAYRTSVSVPTGQNAQVVPLIEEEPLKKNPDEVFEVFWAVYPRRVGKAAARRSFLGLARKVDLQVVVDGARRFAADPNLPEKQFVPHPTTWLNQGRWEDEPLPGRMDSLAHLRPVVESRLEAVPAWVGVLGIPPEEYLERRSEPGWAESMARRAERAAS